MPRLTYGNYDYMRVAGALTGPISDDARVPRRRRLRQARRLLTNVTSIKATASRLQRPRPLLRARPAAVRAERRPHDPPDRRLYPPRREAAAARSMYDTRENDRPDARASRGDFMPIAIRHGDNRIVDILQPPGRACCPTSTRPTRSTAASRSRRAAPIRNTTKDYGGSGQIDWNLGDASLTSITAYREYKSGNAGDVDYSNVDIALSRRRRQRLSASSTPSRRNCGCRARLFDDRLDWLVGGYLLEGESAGRRQSPVRRAIWRVRRVPPGRDASAPTAVLRNQTAPGCLSADRPRDGHGRVRRCSARSATPCSAGSIALSTHQQCRRRRVGLSPEQRELSPLFTHNIFKITDTLSLTAGRCATRTRRRTSRQLQQHQHGLPGAAGGAVAVPRQRGGAGRGAPVYRRHHHAELHRQFTSSQLNGLNLRDGFKRQRSDRHRGAVVEADAAPADLCVSYSPRATRRAATTSIARTWVGLNGAFGPRSNADAAGLRFDAEKVNSYEIGVEVQHAPVHPERRRVPRGVPGLPAQHVQRHGVRRRRTSGSCETA